MSDQPDAFEGIVQEFQEQCRRGLRPSLEAYLARVEIHERRRLASSLIRIDLEYRFQAREKPASSDYEIADEDYRDIAAEILRDMTKADSWHVDPSDSDGLDSTKPRDHQAQASHHTPYPKHERVGPYKLLEEIGEGGMGTVWVAEQTEPIKRKVAIKFVKAGMDSHRVLARFEAERQALAMMDHPNIAKVLDAGMSGQQRPFFVMEYIKGRPMTRYCDDAKLPIEERLKLFIQVCEAVQHAHQKGIIHRDLKPSNILIALYDGKAVPKVIDFGLAKALNQSLTDRTLHTGHDAVLGTPLYMSPEQAESNNLDIDTRSDIYSLGVLLYELLTGTTPLEKHRVTQTGWAEIVRIIKEEEPSRPSTKIHSSMSLSAVAAQRQIEPARLSKLVRGDLDWIVMKALEKDRTRRYDTANSFAHDIHRFLHDEAVEARPPTISYRLGKFAKKNRAVLTTVASLAFLLLAGAAVSTWQAIRATRAETSARASAEAAQLAQAQAESRGTETKAVFDFLEKRIFTYTIPGAEFSVLRQEVKLKEALRDAIPYFESDFADQPRLAAHLSTLMGESFANLGEAEIAEEMLERAIQLRKEILGADHPSTLWSHCCLATAYVRFGNKNAALAVAEQTLTSARAKPIEDVQAQWRLHKSLAKVFRDCDKTDQSVQLYEEVLELERTTLGAEHAETLATTNELALAYQNKGRLDTALKMFEQTLEIRKRTLGENHPDTLWSMSNLASCYQAAGQLDLALAMHEDTLQRRKDYLGKEHLVTLATMNNLAITYWHSKRFDKAILVLEDVLKIAEARLGRQHRQTQTYVHNLGVSYRESNQLELGLKYIEEALEFRRQTLGEDHSETLASLNELAICYQAAGKIDDAIALNEKVVDLRIKKQGKNHAMTLETMHNLAEFYRKAGRLDQAIALYEETLALRKSHLDPDHPYTLTTQNNLAECYRHAGRLEDAIALHEDTLVRRKAKLAENHPETLSSMNNLAWCYGVAGRLDEAIKQHEETLKRRREAFGEDDSRTLDSQNSLAIAYGNNRQLDKSIALLEDLVQRTERLFQRDHFETQFVLFNLGVNYVLAQQFDKAVESLEEVYGFSKQYPSLQGAADELLYTYGACGETAKAVALVSELALAARQKFPPESQELCSDLSNLGNMLLQWKKFEEAERLLREVADIRSKISPDDWRMFHSQSLLGGALVGLKKYEEAEPLLIEGYEGLKQRKDSIPSQGSANLSHALERLIQFYVETERPDEAKKWEEERENL